MAEVPSLHEIAAMPFPASMFAMREHYDPKWHSDAPQDGEGKGRYRVRFDWTISGTFDDVIEADSAEDAREIAEEYARDDARSGDFDVGFPKVERVEEVDPDA